jgi:hypothetical protein
MKRPLRVLSILLCGAIFLRPGNSCSFPDAADVFMQHSNPDAPYSKFVAGRIGLIEGGYRVRHLVVAYRTLSGRALDWDEQKAAVDVDRFYNSVPEYLSDAAADSGRSSAQKEWGIGTRGTEHEVPGENYSTFFNCLQDAFEHASATLADRRAHYGKPGGPDTPEIEDWIAGQRAVFSNCSGPGQSPLPAPASARLWLRQDRAYQIAAAEFYALDYDGALAGFRSIAEDRASPWAQLARYLVARALIRRAVVPFQYASNTPEQAEANNAKVHSGLTEARAQLESILRDPAMKPLQEQSRHLLDYVMARLDPEAQAAELARRITESAEAHTADAHRDYYQNVVDLTYIYNSLPLYSAKPEAKGSAALTAGTRATLIRWIADMGFAASGIGADAMSSPDSRDQHWQHDDALAAWRSTHEPQWLVAAISSAIPGGDGNAELIAAARAVPSSSPAFASVTYHQLRLATAANENPRALYGEVSTLVAQMESSQSRSTVNSFADLQTGLAPTLEEFLKTATRIPASYGDVEGGEGKPLPVSPQNVTLCGVDIYSPETRHLDNETAVILNQRMPLRLLRDAALSPSLPGNARFQLAHMAWTRAVLLDEPEIARSMTAYISGCQPAFKTWLDQYDAAKTPAERQLAGLMALMRFSSTEPTVRIGIERDFASYDSMRDNWWCSQNSAQVPDTATASAPTLFSAAIVLPAQQTDPPFLSDADRTEAKGELEKLEKIPSASDYFARQTLKWVKDHPDDARNADLLGFTMRVVRNACRSDATAELNHQLFDLLHRQYPKSDWAQKYATWE